VTTRGSQCPLDILGLRNRARTIRAAPVNSGRARPLARAHRLPGGATLRRPLGPLGYPVRDT